MRRFVAPVFRRRPSFPGNAARLPPAPRERCQTRPWQYLNFLPEPQGQGELRGILPQSPFGAAAVTAAFSAATASSSAGLRLNSRWRGGGGGGGAACSGAG